MKVRIKFSKHGPLRFIGHLDVMRFFQKAMRRAEIDIAYTSGYSPHQIMSFASPLGVGLESNGEYMDIECHSVTSSQDMKDRLNAVSAPGIEILSVKELPEDAGNAMASVAAAGYTIRFREGKMPRTDYAAMLPGFLAQDQILITKETKTGEKEVDIKPGIFEMCLLQEGQDGKKQTGDISGFRHTSGSAAVYLLVDASSAGNIKPGKVMEAFLTYCGEALLENALLITREDTYTNAGTQEKPVLIPLDEIGSEIS